MANLEIAGAHKRTQKGNVDYYYGGENEAWADLASAKAGVPSSIRPGKTVGVYVSGEIVEYWWPDATHIADGDLIVKQVPLPQALGTADSPTFGNITANGGLAITQSGNSFTTPPIAITNEGDTAGTNSNVLDITLVNPSDPTKKKHFVLRATVPTTAGGNYALQLPEPSLGAATLATTFDITTAVGAANHYRGKYASLSALQTAISSGVDGDYAIVTGSPDDQEYIWDSDHSAWTLTANIPAGTFAGLGGSPTDNGALASALAAKVDDVSGYGLISSSDQTKLNGIATGATANSAAAQSDLTTGTDNIKFLTSSLWTWIKTQVQTIAGIWNFSNGLQVGGNNVETQNNKDASSGYTGLTSFKINFKNAGNTFTSFFTNTNTASRTYTFKDRNGTILDDTDAVTFVDLSSNQTVAGNKTLTGLTSIQSIIPEQRFITSSDSQYSRLQRTTSLSNNLFTGKNQVQQVGGVGRAVWFNTQNCYYTGNDTGLPSGNNNMQVTVAFAYKVPAGVINCFFQQTFVGAGVGNTFGLRYGDRTWYLQIGGTEVATSYYGNIDGNWHGFAFTLTNKTYTFYLDNVLVTSGAFVNNYTVTNAGTSTSMQSSFTNAINNGIQLDQLLIYNRVLTRTSGPGGTDEIAQIYNSGGFTASPPISGLVRRYEFEEGTGTTTTDINPNFTQYPLTLVNLFQWLPTGIVPVAAASSEATFFAVTDGISNGEKGIATWGDFSGRNQQQGKWFQFFQGTNYPLVSNNSGQWLFNSTNTVATPPTIGSTIDIAGNLTIGNYVGTVAPTNGLIVSGTTGLGTSSPSSNYILDMVGSARSQGVFTTYGTTPETRWTTTDTNFGSITRNATGNTMSFTNSVFQVAGKGNSLTFSQNGGSYQYAQGSDTGLPTGSSPVLSLSFWFKYSVSSSSPAVFKYGGTGSAGLQIGLRFNGILTISDGSGNQITTSANSSTFTQNSWHLAVVVINGTSLTWYIDNNAVSATIVTGMNLTLAGSSGLQIGGISTSGFSATNLDQILVYNTALTSANVNTIWAGGNGTLSIPGTPLLRYEFEEGSTGATILNTGSLGTAGNLTPFNSPTYIGTGNGQVPTSGTTSTSTWLKSIDGVNTNERGQLLIGDVIGGTRLQGLTIKYIVNSKIPLITTFNGYTLLSPANTSETASGASPLSVAGGVTIGSTAATATAAPTDGLYVQGNTIANGNLTVNGASSFTGAITYGGTVVGSGGFSRAVSYTTTVRAGANNDYLVGLDLTNITYDSVTGGSALVSATVNSGGTGYVNGTYIAAITAVTGSGTGASAAITVSGGVCTVTSIQISGGAGNGYVIGDQLTVSNTLLGGTGSGLLMTVLSVAFTGTKKAALLVNQIMPSANNTATLGDTFFTYFAGVSANIIYNQNFRGLTNTGSNWATQSGTSLMQLCGITNSLNIGNLMLNGGTGDTGYKIDLSTGSLGSLNASGTVTATSGLARGANFNNTLSPSANNDVLVEVDINPTINLLPTSITLLGSKTAGSGYTNGTYTAQALTGGTGTGATATIVVAGGAVSTVTLVSKGTGYTAGDTLSAAIPAGSGFSIPVSTVGYTGVTPLSLRTSGDIQIGGKLAIPTGSNKSAGTATLVSGTIIISNTLVTANSMVMLSYRNPSGTIGSQLAQGTIVTGASFVVNSLDTSSSVVAGDNNTFNWWIIN
jgi:hypothetical protein